MWNSLTNAYNFTSWTFWDPYTYSIIIIETICIISFNPYNDPVKEDTTIISLCFSDEETKAYRGIN